MSFAIATISVAVLAFIVFQFLNSLNKQIEFITVESARVSLLTDEIRISAVSILKYQRRILARKGTPELKERLLNLTDSFTSQLQTLESLYQDPEVKKVVAKMISYVDSLKVVLGKASLFHRDTVGIQSIGDLADKILDAFSEFQDIQYSQSIERDKKIKDIIKQTKRTMMIVLISGFLFCIILSLVIPGKIALPFKKIKDAIRELQDCNFDVSIYYSQDDEIGEISREMNKMIHSFKVFDELRTDRILIEQRKFDALANMVKRPVLIANAEGRLIYMNNRLYSILQVQSEDVLGKEMTDTVIPESIIKVYELAIKRQSKIENEFIEIPKTFVEVKNENGDEDDAASTDVSETKDVDEETNEEKQPVDNFYATVIPIRGKESSLDYYLMVLSKEVYT